MGRRPTGRRPGRPAGSKDIRPLLIGLLQKYRLYPVLMAEFEAAEADMTQKERLMFSLELAKLGIAASPKTMDVEGGCAIQLVINGVRQGPIDHVGPAEDVVEIPAVPVPRSLPAATVVSSDSRAKSPYVSSTPRPRPVVDPTPLVEDDRPKGPVVRIPFGPPERTAIPAEWREDLFPKGDQ